MKRERLEICWYAVRPILVYLVLFITIQSVLYRLLETVLLGASADMALFYAGWSDLARLLILAISSSCAVIPVLKEGQREIIQMRRRRSSAWICRRKDSSALMGILPLGTLCLSAFLNLLLTNEAAGSEPLSAAAVPMAAAVYGLLTPFIEEVLYRGILWHRLRKGFTALEAAVLSALVFGAAHGELRQGAYGFIMGIVFALGYEFTRQFEVPFLLHSACNLMVLAGTVFSWTDYLRTPQWMVLLAISALGSFAYWGKRLRETKYKL